MELMIYRRGKKGKRFSQQRHRQQKADYDKSMEKTELPEKFINMKTVFQPFPLH